MGELNGERPTQWRKFLIQLGFLIAINPQKSLGKCARPSTSNGTPQGSEASFFERLGGGYLLENVDVRHLNLRLPIQTLSKSEVSTVSQ